MAATLSLALALMDDRNANQTWATVQHFYMPQCTRRNINWCHSWSDLFFGIIFGMGESQLLQGSRIYFKVWSLGFDTPEKKASLTRNVRSIFAWRGFKLALQNTFWNFG
jgi:hypothetical protein